MVRSAEGSGLVQQGVIDSRRLLYFYHVARTGSFTVAETVLHVAQSAISRQIQLLETELNTQLLERNGRGVRLTHAGETFFDQAKTILNGMGDAIEKLRHDGGTEVRRITFASFGTVMSVATPDVVRNFMRLFPDVKIEAHQGTTGDVYDQLAKGEVDVAVLSQPAASKRVFQKKLLVEPVYLVLSKKHPLAGMPFVEREDLSSLDLVLPAAQHGFRQTIERYLSPEINLRVPIRADSMSLAKALVQTGKFGTILPKLSFAPAEGSSRDFVLIPLRPSFNRTLVVATLVERADDQLISCLMNEFVAFFRRYAHSTTGG